MLGGCMLKDVSCRRCGYMSRTRMPFLVLEIPLNKADGQSAKNFAECFEGLFQTSRVLDYKCASCQEKPGPAEITHSMDEEGYPLFFAIELQRGVSAGLVKKRPIEFGFQLSMTKRYTDESVGEELDYDLVAVVMHHGDRVESGHYTSYQRRGDTWYFCDDLKDPSVVEVEAKNGLHDDGSAVMFLYRRR